MEAAAAAAAAAAALVRVTGRDADARRAAAAAFHAAPERGVTSLSVSGAVLRPSPAGAVRVVCPLAPLEAFRAHAPSAPSAEGQAADVEVLLAARGWRTARCVAVVDLLAAAPGLEEALRPLLAGAAGWALGWPPAGAAAAAPDEPQLAAQPAAARAGGSALRVAILELQADAAADDDAAVAPRWASAAQLRRGAPLALAGAPFGALAPAHFAACVAAGCVANALPPNAAAAASAFLLDARTLPGAEGGPVACAATGALVGMLLPPLRPRTPGAPEVPLMVSWDALAAALGEPRPQDAVMPLALSDSSSSSTTVSPAAVARAARGVALVSVRGGGAWGSAVCVGAAGGLYLTAAHLLHPSCTAAGASSAATSAAARRIGDAADVAAAVAGALPPLPRGASAEAALRGADGVWRRAAAVWVCRGALDVALLALEAPLPREGLTQLVPDPEDDDEDSSAVGVAVAVVSPALAQGAPCAVLGHAQFAPAAALPPAAALGVVARCVGASASGTQPSMLLTSAAVHAGASGGAVVGRRGQLLGLVTSNARAAGQASAIPHLNFSVAAPSLSRLCAAARAAPPGACLRPGLPGAPAPLLAACAALDEPDDALSALWALQPPPAPPPPGPRLAAFLERFRDGPADAQRSRL